MHFSVAVDALRSDCKPEGDALLADYVQRYRRLVERLCRIMLADSSDAEDATQQTFLLAYQSLLSGTRPHHPRAWLCTIARRECWARDHRRRRERILVPAETRAEPDPAERTVLRAELAMMNAGLMELPARQRQAIVLRELAGLSYAQLAAALEVSESAAEALLVRARRNLRDARLGLVLLFPFPRWLRRLVRLGSGHARTAVGVQAAKAVAVATIVTATVTVAGSGVSAQRALAPAPIVAERTVPAPRPDARAPHRRVPARRATVRGAPPHVARASRTQPAAAPAHVETSVPAPAPPRTIELHPSAAESPSTTLPRPSPQPSPATPQTEPTAPRPHATAPKPAATPRPAPTPTATTPAPPVPTETAPAPAPPPPPTDTTGTAPSDPQASGTPSGADGDTKPGNGYGDKNHDHDGKR